MRITPWVLIGGVAVAALVGFAVGESLNFHTLTVRLPDGGVEKVYYSGQIAPRLTVTPVLAAAPDWAGEAPVFDMQQASAEMDRDTTSLLQQAEALQAHALVASGGPRPTMLTAPDGARSFSFVSTLSGLGLCTRSVEVTSLGAGRNPRVVTHASGDCGSATAPRTQTRAPVAAAPPAAPALQTASFSPAGKPAATKVAAAF